MLKSSNSYAELNFDNMSNTRLFTRFGNNMVDFLSTYLMLKRTILLTRRRYEELNPLSCFLWRVIYAFLMLYLQTRRNERRKMEDRYRKKKTGRNEGKVLRESTPSHHLLGRLALNTTFPPNEYIFWKIIFLSAE